jgi:hypothetical protein
VEWGRLSRIRSQSTGWTETLAMPGVTQVRTEARQGTISMPIEASLVSLDDGDYQGRGRISGNVTVTHSQATGFVVTDDGLEGGTPPSSAKRSKRSPRS